MSVWQNMPVYSTILVNLLIMMERYTDSWVVESLQKVQRISGCYQCCRIHHGEYRADQSYFMHRSGCRYYFCCKTWAQEERDTETYTNRLKQLEDITNSFKGVDKSFAIPGRTGSPLWLFLNRSAMTIWYCWQRDISKRIEDELEYPGQIKVNVIRESRKLLITRNKKFSAVAVQRGSVWLRLLYLRE